MFKTEQSPKNVERSVLSIISTPDLTRVEILEPWGAEEEMQTQFKTTL